MIINKFFQTPSNENFFFGYHDTSQISPDDKHILAIKVDNIGILPSYKFDYEIFIFDILNKTSKKISSTKTINFQQGSRLHWIDNLHFITNDCDLNKYFSKIINIKTGHITKKFDQPIYSISSNKKFAITLDFERLYWVRRGYSYDAIINKFKNQKINYDESISIIDIESGITKKLFSLRDILKIDSTKIMNNATHYLEHISISPDDKKFIFLHRFKLDDGGIFSRMFKYEISKKKLSLLLDSGRVSHFSWKSENELIFYGSFGNFLTGLRKINKLKKIFKKLLFFYKYLIKDNSTLSKIATGDGYKILDVETNYKLQIKIENLNKEDGHPTNFSKNIFITDNYPDHDNNNTASLYEVNVEKNIFNKLLELKSIKKYDNSPLRCDLHPRFSVSKHYLSIDSMENNHRSCIVFKVFE